MVAMMFAHTSSEALQRAGRVPVAARPPRSKASRDPLDQRDVRLREQRVLRAVVVADGRQVRPGLLDDVARGRAREALLQQAALGAFEQILTMSHASSVPRDPYSRPIRTSYTFVLDKRLRRPYIAPHDELDGTTPHRAPAAGNGPPSAS